MGRGKGASYNYVIGAAPHQQELVVAAVGNEQKLNAGGHDGLQGKEWQEVPHRPN